MTELTSALQPDTERRATFLGDAWQQLARNPIFWVAGTVVAVMSLMAIAPGLFAGWFDHGDPRVCELANSGGEPGHGHPFGFDKQGCDVYANAIYGARASISVGVLVTLWSLVLAVLLGSLAGFYGRVVDVIVSRLTDVFFGFPFILGALVVLTSFDTRNVWTVSLVLAMFGWPTLTRLMRSTVLATTAMEYVTAARALGASDRRIIFRHILPNAIAPVIVIGTLGVGGVIVAEAALTFLGVGLQSPAISWGLQLSTAQNDFEAYPHLLVFPSVFLSVTVLAFILLGDVLRDALDPRLHR